MTPSQRIVILGGAALDPDAKDWAARVSAAGGSVSASVVRAQSTFIKALKAGGIWTKINRGNNFVGDFTACLVPYKVGSGSATETNTNFVSGDYSQAAGLTGNGSNKSLNTGVQQDVFTNADRHLMAYVRVRSGTTADTDLGSETAAATNQWCLSTDSVTSTSQMYRGGGNTGGTVISALAPVGMYLGQNLTSTSQEMYINGASVGTGTPNAATPGAVTISVFALNRAGTPLSFSAATLGGYSIGTRLTAGEVAAYYTALQNFQTALGRQV